MSRAGFSASYVPLDTPVHRVDPRVKLGLLLAWTWAVMCTGGWPGVGAAAAGTAALARAAGMRPGDLWRCLSPLAVVAAVVVCSSAMKLDDPGAWRLAGGWGLSPQGAAAGLLAACRIVVAAAMSVVVAATTTSGLMNEALLWCMSPLGRLGVPVGDVAMTLSVAVRFIPLCAEQLDRIVMCQRARGASFGTGGPLRRARAWAGVAVPLFVAMFRRSEALARAMEARCYRGEGRTRIGRMRMRPADFAALAAGAALAVLAAVAL